MKTSRSNPYWLILILFLLVVIAANVVFILTRLNANQPIEIILQKPAAIQGEVYIDGAINNPGIYPFKPDGNIANLIQSAGGLAGDAVSGRFKLYVPHTTEVTQPQKVDINHAESWLLQALPDIGKTRAQAIIDYRNRNGAFHNTYELTQVEGIGIPIYEKIKNLIIVSDYIKEK